MLRYSGGKHRLCKKIAAIIREYRKTGQLYVEPFLGGASVFAQVDHPKIAGELNKYVAAMWNAAILGWIPPDNIDEKLYYEIRSNMEAYPPELVGFAMVACSFGGHFADSYAMGKDDRIYALIGKRSLLIKSNKMESSKITQGDYRQFSEVADSIIYCDPPYRGTVQKYSSTKFDSAAFWDWCRMMSEKNVVLVSEYSAPSGIQEIASWELTKNIKAGKTEHKAIERLYLVGNPKRQRGQIELF